MRDADGKLLHRYRNGQAGIAGQAADYAYLIFGLTELYMATFDPAYLSAAIELERHFDTHFWDHANGGYFTVPGNQTDLVARQKELYDGALPSPNSVAFSNLLRLAMLTGDTSFEKRASDLSRLYAGLLDKSPAACTFFLSGICLLFGQATEVVLVEGPRVEQVKDMTDSLNRLYLPFMVVLSKNEMTAGDLAKTAPFTNELGPVEGKTAAYVCSRNTCSVPVTGVKELLKLVGGEAGASPFRKKSDIS
jgi:hypothetical protein